MLRDASTRGLEKISIDYAVMENAKDVLVVQAPYQWDDVGSWLALERMHPQDADGNTVLGDALRHRHEELRHRRRRRAR